MPKLSRTAVTGPSGAASIPGLPPRPRLRPHAGEPEPAGGAQTELRQVGATLPGREIQLGLRWVF